MQVFHTFFTVELDGGEWPISSCDHFLPVERAHGPQFFFRSDKSHFRSKCFKKFGPCLFSVYLTMLPGA
jgi:hypothetical protein